MNKMLKSCLSLTLALSTVMVLVVPVTAETKSSTTPTTANGGSINLNDPTGLGIDISMPSITDPNEAKPEVVSGEYTYKVQDDGTAIITQYKGKGGDVTVPALLDQHKVTHLGEGSFQQCNVKSIKLPESLTVLGAASLSANLLTQVTIPKSVKYVDFGVFTGNTELKTVTVVSYDTTFGWGVFEFCPSDITVYAPKGSAAEAYAKNKAQGFKFIAKPAAQPKLAIAAPGSFVAKQVPMKRETAVIRDVKCTWAAVKGAAGYDIYHGNYGALESVGTTTATTYTLRALSTEMYHYVKVRPYQMVKGKKVYGNDSVVQYISVTNPYLDK